MSLTELAARKAKPEDRLVKFSDGGGLQLWVFPDGAKRWRLAYRAGGSQKLLAIGVYPDVGLKDAREAREAAKKILAAGGDPMAVKKQAKAEQAIASANTFETIAAELVEKKRDEDKAAQTISKTEWLLSLAYPEIGSRQSRRSRLLIFCACFAASQRAADSSRRSACARPSGRSSATPSRPARRRRSDRRS